jgi:caspase domain-containing protein
MIYARLIGIDIYQNGPRLYGCNRDVDNMTIFLTGLVLGIQVLSPKLHDQTAPRSAMWDALRADVRNLKHGDQLIVHFSGHGTTVDVMGVPHAAACPFNFREQDASTGILDSDLDLIFNDLLDGRRVTIFADCCFSGGLQKNWFLRVAAYLWRGVRRTAMKLRRRALPNVRIRRFSRAAGMDAAQPAFGDGGGRDVVVLAANRGNSGEHDFGYGSEGIFTHFLIQHLSAGNIAQPATTTRDKVNDLTGTGGFGQRADLHGNTKSFNKPLIDISAASAPPPAAPGPPLQQATP